MTKVQRAGHQGESAAGRCCQDSTRAAIESRGSRITQLLFSARCPKKNGEQPFTREFLKQLLQIDVRNQILLGLSWQTISDDNSARIANGWLP
jgi:hypothetical protein